jgi:hypothetical protein
LLRSARNDESWARLRLFEFQRAQLSADHEIVVVEHQCARNAVLVKLEADGVSRCLFVVFRFLAFVEIADRDRPARDTCELSVVGGGIVVRAPAAASMPDFKGSFVEQAKFPPAVTKSTRRLRLIRHF